MKNTKKKINNSTKDHILGKLCITLEPNVHCLQDKLFSIQIIVK